MSTKSETKPFLEILTILNTLRGIFQELVSYEKNKREILLKRQPRELEQLLIAQEDLLREVHRLELLVNILFQEISRNYGYEIKRLSDLEQLDGLASTIRQKISSLRVELHELAQSLQVCAMGNEKIIKDNIDFFQEVLKSFQQSIGYGPTPGGIARPLFVDSTV